MRDLFAGGVGLLGLALAVMGLTGHYGLIFQWLHIQAPGLEQVKNERVVPGQ